MDVLSVKFSLSFLAVVSGRDVYPFLLSWLLNLLLVGRLPTLRFSRPITSLTAASLFGVCATSTYYSVLLHLSRASTCLCRPGCLELPHFTIWL